MKPILVLQHVPHETLGTLAAHFRDAGLTWRYVELFREVPEQLDLADAAGLVVLGGPMNVDQTEAYPFLAFEPGWIRQAVDAGLPVLGICLGAQLLAKALGAAVYPNPVKEIGWYTITLTDAAGVDPLFGGSSGDRTVFQWHGDTFDLPDGAIRLASSPVCRHQAFAYRQNAWGLQFHVEMTAELVDRWLDEPGNQRELADLGTIDPAAIRTRTAEGLRAMQELAGRVLPRFAARCGEAAR